MLEMQIYELRDPIIYLIRPIKQVRSRIGIAPKTNQGEKISV